MPGGSAGNRSCPFGLVIATSGPPISAGDLTRTTAPGSTAPCASLTVPMIIPVAACVADASVDSRDAAAIKGRVS